MFNQSYLSISLYKKMSVILFLTVFVSGCLSLPEFIEVNDNARVTIDEELFSQPIVNNELAGLVVVAASINGVDGFEFVLDTGAAGTLIFESDKTRALNLKTNGTYNVGGSGSDSKALAKIGVDVDISIGGATINDMAPLIMNWQDASLFESSDGVYIDGIIGYDLFNRFLVDIDPSKKTVQLYRADDEPTLDGLNALELPITFKTRRIFADIQVSQTKSGKHFSKQVLVDSGMTGTLALVEGQNGINIPDDAIESIATGLQGDSKEYKSKVESINLAGVAIDDLPATIKPKDWPSSVFSEAMLGADVLNRFRQLIDYKNKKIKLIPQSIEEPFSEVTFGLKVRPSGDYYVAYGLSEDKPAYKSGLRNKDKVISVNELETTEVSYRSLINVQPAIGDVLKLCFLREANERQCIDITAS